MTACLVWLLVTWMVRGLGAWRTGMVKVSAPELAGLHPQTLRVCEREGLLDPARSAGGTRRYSRRDIDRIAGIGALTAGGLNLAGIRRVLAVQGQARQLRAELARLRARPAGPGNLQLLLTVSCSASYMKTVSVIDLATLAKVPGRVIGMTVSTREADAAFADVVYADQQWADAGFDALISAASSEPPAPPPPAPPRVPPHPAEPFPPSRRPRPGRDAATVPAAAPVRGRQRSPPAPPATGPPPPLLTRQRPHDSEQRDATEGGRTNSIQSSLLATRYAAGIPAGDPRRRAARASRCRIRTGTWRPSCRRGGAVVADLLEPDGGVREQDQVVVAEDDLNLGAGGSSRSAPVQPETTSASSWPRAGHQAITAWIGEVAAFLAGAAARLPAPDPARSARPRRVKGGERAMEEPRTPHGHRNDRPCPGPRQRR